MNHRGKMLHIQPALFKTHNESKSFFQNVLIDNPLEEGSYFGDTANEAVKNEYKAKGSVNVVK